MTDDAVSVARQKWVDAQTRETEARAAFIGALREARQHGATLQQLADALQVSRQYVHKLLSD